MLIDKALNRGYVLSPLRGTSPPPGGAGLCQALRQRASNQWPSPGGGRGNHRMTYGVADGCGCEPPVVKSGAGLVGWVCGANDPHRVAAFDGRDGSNRQSHRLHLHIERVKPCDQSPILVAGEGISCQRIGCTNRDRGRRDDRRETGWNRRDERGATKCDAARVPHG